MNNPHKNARMTPLGRAEMVRRIQGGQPLAVVAAGFGISERTARKWLARYRKDGPAGLENRSSRPRTVANRTGEPWLASIERLRRAYRLTGEEIAEKLSMARSTVAGWLARFGLGRLASLDPKPPIRRYQRERPGELLHLDIKKLARFEGVGHRITGDRRGRSQGMGYDCLHVAIDDATRLAYVEVLPDEKRQSTTGFLVRARRWFRARGVRVERVMTAMDRAMSQSSSAKPYAFSAYGTFAHGLTRRKPMARPSDSSRPCYANGPTRYPSSRPLRVPPISTDGSRGITSAGRIRP